MFVKRSHIVLFHLLVVFPLMAYIGYYGVASNPNAFKVLLAMAILGFLQQLNVYANM